MPETRYTTADRDALDEPLTHRERLITDRIQSELERSRLELERIADGALLRGRIAALRMVLTLPEILTSEIEMELKEPKRVI